MFSKILVANRGEIAVRIMHTIREMGLTSVAVYSDADASALHVLTADEAVNLGDSDPASSYLHIDKIIDAAQKTGAEAVHPGYGFLAENPDFAQAVVEAGLTFIGPPGDVMAKLGDKTEARRLMQTSGVPIIPGMTEVASDRAALAAEAENLGYPVLIKAAAGGGGKGMRVVDSAENLAAAITEAASEAAGAFGDESIYLEKCLEKPRHVEVQVLADTQGNVVHLFERECSIQRRHQKIIEETPSPAVDDDLRDRMGRAAVAAAQAAGYRNAGTVEFLLEASGEFYFLEVNTRIQVEHPVTEMVTGLDLVKRQIEIAAGEPLPFTQEEISRRGHAIECRIYAEDPENNFMPSPGPVLFTQKPSGPGVRYDSGIYTGCEVPVHYDPILGKLIAWAEDRPAALARMIRALEECVVLGVKTPIEFMMDILRSPAFQAGDIDTNFIDNHFAGWRPSIEGDRMGALGFVAEELTGATTAPPTRPRGVGRTDDDWNSPWRRLGAWDMAG